MLSIFWYNEILVSIIQEWKFTMTTSVIYWHSYLDTKGTFQVGLWWWRVRKDYLLLQS